MTGFQIVQDPLAATAFGIETSRFFGANIGRPGSTLIEVFRFAGDSPLEEAGFELVVPL